MTRPTTGDYVTHNEFDLAMARIDGRFDALEARIDGRFEAFEARMNGRFETLEARMDALFERATLTGIRGTVGMSFGLYALMFGLILFVISRELPHG